MIADLKLDRVIGCGAWGCVWHAVHRDTGESYAVKAMSKYGLIKDKQADHALSERKILPKLDHPFIVKFESFAQDKRCIYFVQEFINGGEFLTLLKQNKRLSTAATQFYAAQIAVTLKYIHSRGIVYRDLKPENMLVDRKGYLKLIDFGLSKEIKSKDSFTETTMTICGTPHYIAPEILKNKGYSYEVDWWSFGVVLYETLIGIMPFEGKNASELFYNIAHEKVRFPADFDENAKTLIAGLLRKDPKKRYSAKKVLKHKFFAGVDFQALLERKLECPYFPSVKGRSDTSNFKEIKVPTLNKENCPEILEGDIFKDW